MDPRDLIKRPVITERSSDLMEQGKYVFEVDRRVNKTEIRQAVEKLFGVKVEWFTRCVFRVRRSASARHVGTLRSGKRPLSS